MSESTPIELSELIEEVRDELMVAKEQGKDRDLKFDIELAQIEIQFSVRREIKGKGGIKFYVVEAGGEAKTARETVQKITLQLRPKDSTGGTFKTTG